MTRKREPALTDLNRLSLRNTRELVGVACSVSGDRSDVLFASVITRIMVTR